MAYVMVGILSIFIVVREVLHFKERKDMLDRLMAKSLPEYKDNHEPEKNDIEPKDDGLQDLDEVRDQLLGDDNE